MGKPEVLATRTERPGACRRGHEPCPMPKLRGQSMQPRLSICAPMPRPSSGEVQGQSHGRAGLVAAGARACRWSSLAGVPRNGRKRGGAAARSPCTGTRTISCRILACRCRVLGSNSALAPTHGNNAGLALLLLMIVVNILLQARALTPYQSISVGLVLLLSSLLLPPPPLENRNLPKTCPQ